MNAALGPDGRYGLWALMCAFGLAISGCGGGGGSSGIETAPPPPVPQGPAGTLDPSFGTGGIVFTRVGDHGTFAAVVLVQADDKIIAVGGASVGISAGRTLIRYNADGTLDHAFGSGGKVFVLDVGFANGATLQPDGKIVTGGTGGSSGPGGYCMLARFRSDGSLDPSFGVAGVVAIQLTNPDSTPLYTNGCTVALQTDGKLVVAAPAGVGTAGKLGAMRFNTDGTRDASFGAGGAVVVTTTYPGIRTTSITVQPDGKIIVVGGDIDSTPGLQVRNNETMLMRLDSTGMLDTSFGQGGVVQILRSEGAFLALPAIALQLDGKIVALGVWGQVLRLLPNGVPDLTFGEGGAAHDIYGFSVAVQSNGRIVIAGFSPPTGESNLALWRLTADGLPDSEFGNGGFVFDRIGASSQAGPIAIQRDGRIVAAGSSVSSPLDVVMARYLGDPAATSSP